MARHRIGDGTPHSPEEQPAKPVIEAGEFFDVDLRIGTVTAVEDFPEARKPAWKVTVDFGPVIGVLCTSAQVTNYAAEELVGRQVVGVLNLGTRRIAGFESEFLVLGGLESDGTVRLLAPDTEMADGSIVA